MFTTGPKSQAMIRELQHYVVMDPMPFAIDLANSRGMMLATVDGQQLTDWTGYYGAKLLSHNHPGLSDPSYQRELVLAANNKLANPDFLTPQCLDYYKLLHELAPRCMAGHPIETYAVNSGAEAVENMMKYLIKLHHMRQISQGRQVTGRRFLYFRHGFHGRTVFALNITSLPHDAMITADYHGLIQGNIGVPFPALDSDADETTNQNRARQSLRRIRMCLERHADQIVAIIVEPIQGAGGHRMAPPGFFRELSSLAHEFGVYLAFDEVQTAGGQTGTVFAIDQLNLPHPPQAVATGKKFGNGVVYMLATIGDMGVLDSTWGGSLADMVRVVREFQIINDQHLMALVPQKAARLIEGLHTLGRQYPDLFANVRGMGLYQGFSCRPKVMAAQLRDDALYNESLLLLGAGPGHIRLRPPLDVTEDDIDTLLMKLSRIAERLAYKTNRVPLRSEP